MTEQGKPPRFAWICGNCKLSQGSTIWPRCNACGYDGGRVPPDISESNRQELPFAFARGVRLNGTQSNTDRGPTLSDRRAPFAGEQRPSSEAKADG
jgi:hypothetical protein